MGLPDPSRLHRVGGNLALDFVNTVSWRNTDRETDHLATDAALFEWAHGSGVISDASALELDRCGAHEVAQSLATAHELRAAIMAAATAIAAGAQPSPYDLDVVVAVGRESLAHSRLAPDPGLGFRFDFDAATGSGAILGPVAWAAIDLFRSGPLERLKRCPPADCGWLFLDTTKNGTRRWCSMEACGNRMKAQRRKR